MNVSPTTAMTNIITQILVEVLKIFGIATKELKLGSASKFQRFDCVWVFSELSHRKVSEEACGNGRFGRCPEET